MRFHLSIILFSILIPCLSKAQVFPLDSSVLNYRIIGFSAETETRQHDRYKWEIAPGNFASESSFNKNITQSFESKESRLVAEVPDWGADYTWRYTTIVKNKATASPLFHFRTGNVPSVDTAQVRLRILHAATAHKDAYIFIDDSKTLYDLNGRAVWYLPKVNGIPIIPRDIKVSPAHTITLLFDPPYEVNYNGEVLWKGPPEGKVSGDNTEHYHHVFTRLHSGHYMVMGQDSVAWRPAGLKSVDKRNDSFAAKTQFGTLIEYDERGNVVWSWHSSGYFVHSDLNEYPFAGKKTVDVHENSFFFDEADGIIYVGFKNISRILKIKYPEGTVVSTYGRNYDSTDGAEWDKLYCGQHAVKLSQDGHLFLFNNNSCDPLGFPTVAVFKEPGEQGGRLEKVWEFNCSVQGATNKKNAGFDFSSGGNVLELPGGDFFVSMSSSYGKMFIVNHDKQVLWSALPERWEKTSNRWQSTSEYRASIIPSRAELEQLIWASQQKPGAAQQLLHTH